MRYILLVIVTLFIVSCKKDTEIEKQMVNAPQDIQDISSKDFREFKVLDSKLINSETLWKGLDAQLEGFSEKSYNALKPLILDQNIPTLQDHIANRKLTYETLTKFYLYRIRKYDRNNHLSLNSVISINPNAVSEAKRRDKALNNRMKKHLIFGMPILLKDNINTENMPTTAGALALKDNRTKDAFITAQLKDRGAIILGKANLSEWAYFFCGDCPSGYSAIGGQTLNPYGRRIFDTGGSSSGSGVAVATEFAVGAIGSETSGSILSPSSQNSIVGLKPTVGLLSRTGVVPISSTLDTPGPMTKNVIDNAIVLEALLGFDEKDFKSVKTETQATYFNKLNGDNLTGKRFGAFKEFMEDPLYAQAIELLKANSAIIVQIDEPDVELPEFLRLLNLDMKVDLAKYFESEADPNLNYKTIEDVMTFNTANAEIAMPYGQSLFEGVAKDTSTDEEFETIKEILKTNGRQYFDVPMSAFDLDAVLSINNYNAGEAAVAEYPAITVPMGYDVDGMPKGLTFISKPLSEEELLQWAYGYEQISKARKAPKAYN